MKKQYVRSFGMILAVAMIFTSCKAKKTDGENPAKAPEITEAADDSNTDINENDSDDKQMDSEKVFVPSKDVLATAGSVCENASAMVKRSLRAQAIPAAYSRCSPVCKAARRLQ